MVVLPTLTDAWYWLAFRVMRLIKKNCPEMGSFEVRGITLTRNKLMEHIDEGVHNANFAIGGEGGPEVKGPRWDGQSEEFADLGMFANADEFDSQLRTLLDEYPIRDVKETLAENEESPGPATPAAPTAL
jgi:hypothetical protein